MLLKRFIAMMLRAYRMPRNACQHAARIHFKNSQLLKFGSMNKLRCDD